MTLDIGSDRTDALSFHIGKDRRLVIEKLEPDIHLEKFLKAPLRRAAHASWEGKHFFDKRRRIVAAADSKRATTIPMPLAWQRQPERCAIALTLDEIDDHIGQLFPKIVAECRAEAAKRFGVDAIDTMLVAARALDVCVDKHKAPRGEGVLGNEISLILELTFAERGLYDQFHSFFSAPEPFFFMESAQARLGLLERLGLLPVNLIVGGNGNPEGSLFVLQPAKEKYPVLYRERFPWPFDQMLDQLAYAFSVSRGSAEEMYRMYMRDSVSPTVRRRIEAFVAPWAEKFSNAVRKAKVRGSLFIDAPYPVPYELPHHEGKATLENFPLEDVLKKFDLALEPGPLAGNEPILWRHLAPFFSMYFDHAQGALNERLRKRVHWLAR